MNIKVIQCVETGKYLEDYYEEAVETALKYVLENLI